MLHLSIFLVGLLGLLYAGFTYWSVKKIPTERENQRLLAEKIRQGAQTFLVREYKVMFLVASLIFIGLYFLKAPHVAYTFALGAVTSGLAGVVGLNVATITNLRTASAAEKSLRNAFEVSFTGSTVTGVTVITLALLALGITSYLFRDLETWFGLSFGASLVAFFARVGGGIFTKSADMTADYVGKVERSLPEDDARNPAVIADNVGDNVGDVAGMSADLFESYVGSLIAACTIGAMTFGAIGVAFPLILSSCGLLASLVGIFGVRKVHSEAISHLLHGGIAFSNAIVIVVSYFLSLYFFDSLFAFYAITIGAFAGIGIGLATEYYTAVDYQPVKKLAESCKSGPATVIVEGIATGMGSTAIPILLLVAAIGSTNWIGGLYGISLAAVGMLSTLAISLSVDAYGPTVDNAGGIVQMSHMAPEIRRRTDRLDAVGNTTAAIGKGFAIASAAMTALIFFFTYTLHVKVSSIDLINPMVIIGLFIGSLVPFLFCSLAIRAVGQAMYAMVSEIRQQFTDEPGILDGTTPPNYNRCIDIATQSSLKSMLPGGILGIGTPIAVKFLLGPEALGGVLAGALASGLLLAIFQANAGGAWDNAKKTIEEGACGGSGSPAHQASVIGDTVGDPLKDTSGPALNILIKLMAIVSLII